MKIEMSKEMGVCYNVTGAGMFVAGIIPLTGVPEETTVRSLFGWIALIGVLIFILGLWPPARELLRRMGEWKRSREPLL